MSPLLQGECARLADNCAVKRGFLIAQAHRLGRLRKILNFLAGFLALLSSGSLLSLLAGYGGDNALKVTAAILSFLAGIVSLGLGMVRNDRELSEMMKGAAEYLRLREDANSLAIDDALPDAKVREQLKKKTAEYAILDTRYNRYWDLTFSSVEVGGSAIVCFNPRGSVQHRQPPSAPPPPPINPSKE